MGELEIQYCPICRKNPLPPEQILCPDCQADNPYNLLGGYSPTKTIHGELKKIGEYKDQISSLQRRLRSAGLIIIVLSITVAVLVVANWGFK